jgi:hypothetical protein
MGEYGRVVGQGSETARGTAGKSGGGGVTDLGGDVVGTIGNAIDQVAALPPEVLLLLAAAVLIGFVVLRRAF